MPDPKFLVTCPTCGNDRWVTRVQKWQIESPKGRSSGNCKSCAMLGNSKSAGFTPQARAAGIKAVTGNKYNWRGGKSAEIHRLRNSAEGIRWRKAVLARDNHTCQECGTDKDIETHHIKGFTEFPEFRFDVDNGLTLCRPCHKKTDSFGCKSKA